MAINGNPQPELIKQGQLSEAGFSSLEEILSEEARFLAPTAEELAANWAELYLSVFGRNAFFSSQRVHKVFKELVDLFIFCLRDKRLDYYLESLKAKGATFSRLGVPFDEIIMSLHLFEEVCVEPFLNASFSESKLSQMILAMGELHNQGLASLAISYFESTKKDMEMITEGLTEENGNLKKELLEAKDTLFANTMRELNSMQLAISGINHKLRRRVYQLGRVQKIAEVLESEAHLPRLLKMASYQVLALCPENSNLFFAFFDEERKKVNLYHQESKSNPECDLIKTFYFSELPGMFQQVLFDESTKLFHLDSHEEIPAALSSLLMIKNQKDFLLMPIRKYREVTGFMLLGVPAEDFFSKSNYKFYQHVGQVVSKSVTSAALFTKSKQRDDFELIISELTKRKFLSGTLETTLDFCLGSLIDLLGVERSSLMRYDEGHMNLAVYAAKGYKVYPISGSKIKFGEGIAGMALKEAKIISIDKMKEVNAARPEIKVKSLLCVPLIENDTPLGVVNMSTISYYKHFEKSDIEMAHHVINRMTGILKELNQNTPTSFI